MEIPMIGLRQFRETLDEQTQAIKVVKTRGDITILGTWFPDGEYTVESAGEVFTVRPRGAKVDKTNS